jgi:hypothetical protein
MTDKQASIFDIPGWPCPPSVGQIASTKDTWGLVTVISIENGGAVGYDETGKRWANAQAVPRYALPDEGWASPGAIVAWTEQGLGVFIHPQSLRYLPQLTLDQRMAQPDTWIPVAMVLAELPHHVKPQ